MMHNYIALIFPVIFALTSGFLFGGGPSWNDFRITWSANIGLGKWTFDNLPRTVWDAKDMGWEKKDDFCKVQGPFKGQRYWFKMDFGMDPAVLLIFDKNGYIAGIQTHLPKGAKIPTKELNNKYFIEESDGGVTLTMYFIAPSRICDGRTEENFENEGTGTGFYIQNGPDPLQDIFHTPKYEEDAVKEGWVGRNCLPTMGRHYWLDVHKDSDCNKIRPFFLLYNQGELNAFAFVFSVPLGYPEPLSPRYELNDVNSVAASMTDVPECLATSQETNGKWIVMHTYMSSPYKNICGL